MFDLTTDWVKERLDAGVCEVTGIPFRFDLSGHRNLYGPSLDRTVPEEGYTRANTRVVLFAYNSAKNGASPQETREMFLAVAGALA